MQNRGRNVFKALSGFLESMSDGLLSLENCILLLMQICNAVQGYQTPSKMLQSGENRFKSASVALCSIINQMALCSYLILPSLAELLK